MTNLFKISIPTEPENHYFIKQFSLAFNDIYSLSKLLCSSNNEKVVDYIASYVPEDSPWLSISNDSVNIFAECREICINKDDCQNLRKVTYAFGKRSPASDQFFICCYEYN